MFHDTNFPPPDGRLAQLMRVVADFERDEIEAGVDGLIALLDAMDGDPDLEDSDDDRGADEPGEGLTWPERVDQPAMMANGTDLWAQDDDEPDRVPAIAIRQVANDV